MRPLLFFPARVFVRSVCLCVVRKVPAAISGVLVAAESRGAATLAAHHVVPMPLLAFPPKLWLWHQGRVEHASLGHLGLTRILPPRQDPKSWKDHFLVFVFNVNSQASLCAQCEIIPNPESDKPIFFLCINMMYLFCLLVPCSSLLPLETCLRYGYCEALFWLPTQQRMKMALVPPALLYGVYVLARWYNRAP